MPVGLFHTLKGPLIGKVAKKDATRVRVFAPAMLGQPVPSKVIFLPIAFCEEYIELFWTTMFGASPPPNIVVQGYKSFFDQFVKGAYNMQPLLMNAGVDAAPVTVDDPRFASPEGLLPCPACKQLLSHWAAHYPVMAGGQWICEVTKPDVRDLFPDYDAQAVVDAQKKGDSNGTSTRV
jgi:hypothetical protein